MVAGGVVVIAASLLMPRGNASPRTLEITVVLIAGIALFLLGRRMRGEPKNKA
jgi:hypothetical protein